MDITGLTFAARGAAYELMKADTLTRNGALEAIANALDENCGYILEANAKDVAKAREKGVKTAMIDRLTLDENRVKGMAQGLRDVAALPDPLGSGELFTRPNGLQIEKRRVPLGVIGIIYEARPNVTTDAIGLCIKSGNAVILRGGSEAIESNKAIVTVCVEALNAIDMPSGCVGLIEDTSHQAALQMMRANGEIDVLIPRGGSGLIRTVVENSTVPVIETGTGNCHVYIDDDADIDMGARIIFNAKCSRPAVCNAAEKLLIARSIAPRFIEAAFGPLKAKGVELRGCPETCELYPSATPATEEDWFTEYNDFILGVKIVDGIDEAIGHINTYGTRHSEVIVTENYSKAQRFLREIDAAAVYVNASSRFTDGGEFGLGAEIGISTQKLHARGPMGLEQLTTIKYCVYGSGQIR